MFMIIIIIIIIIIILIITFSFTTNVSTGAGFLPLHHRSHRFGGTMKDADREAASAPDNTMTQGTGEPRVSGQTDEDFLGRKNNSVHLWHFNSFIREILDQPCYIMKKPLTFWTQKWRLGRWFSLSIGWFLGFMLIFQGFLLTWWRFARCNIPGQITIIPKPEEKIGRIPLQKPFAGSN